MIAFKFLARGAIGPFSGRAWPSAGWVEASGPLVPGKHGVHVCRATDLAHWLHDELWEVETEGEEVEGLDCVAVRRARLFRRVDRWSKAGAAAFAEACRARGLAALGLDGTGDAAAYLDDAREAAEYGYVAVSAFTSAVAVAQLAPADQRAAAFRAERRAQSDWLAREIVGRS